jgi:hypothetical protein
MRKTVAKIDTNCTTCGFPLKNPTVNKFCSRLCWRKSKVGKPFFFDRTPKIKYICKGCGVEFLDCPSLKRAFCSKRCYHSNHPKQCGFRLGNCGFQLSGEKHCCWKGGITPINKKIRRSREYKTWRAAVFKRDNWVCGGCNVRGGILHPHHIKPFAAYPDLRFEVGNGKTLCVACHKKEHKIKTFSCE